MVEIWFCKTKDPHGYMQNFYRRPMVDQVTGLLMCASEAVYQSRKFNTFSIKQAIAQADNPFMAKQIAYRYPIEVPNWDNDRCLVEMFSVVYDKYKQHPDLAELLKQTYPARIFELSYKDLYWGTPPNRSGKNHLGLITETVREML